MTIEDRFALTPRRHNTETDWFGLEANPSGNIQTTMPAPFTAGQPVRRGGAQGDVVTYLGEGDAGQCRIYTAYGIRTASRDQLEALPREEIQHDATGRTLQLWQQVRIGKGKTLWVVRWLRPDLDQIGMTGRPGNCSGYTNRCIEPRRVHIVD